MAAGSWCGSYRAQAPAHLSPVQPARVRLALHQMADTHQAVAARTRAQGTERLPDAVGREVGPADHPGDRARFARQRQELGRLCRTGEHLNQDRPVDSGRRGERREVGHGEVPADGGHPGAVQPRLRPPGELPEVVVCVDPDYAPPAWSNGVA
jgi:hypothetical protein